MDEVSDTSAEIFTTLKRKAQSCVRACTSGPSPWRIIIALWFFTCLSSDRTSHTSHAFHVNETECETRLWNKAECWTGVRWLKMLSQQWSNGSNVPFMSRLWRRTSRFPQPELISRCYQFSTFLIIWSLSFRSRSGVQPSSWHRAEIEEEVGLIKVWNEVAKHNIRGCGEAVLTTPWSTKIYTCSDWGLDMSGKMGPSGISGYT